MVRWLPYGALGMGLAERLRERSYPHVGGAGAGAALAGGGTAVAGRREGAAERGLGTPFSGCGAAARGAGMPLRGAGTAFSGSGAAGRGRATAFWGSGTPFPPAVIKPPREKAATRLGKGIPGAGEAIPEGQKAVPWARRALAGVQEVGAEVGRLLLQAPRAVAALRSAFALPQPARPPRGGWLSSRPTCLPQHGGWRGNCLTLNPEARHALE